MSLGERRRDATSLVLLFVKTVFYVCVYVCIYRVACVALSRSFSREREFAPEKCRLFENVKGKKFEKNVCYYSLL